MWQQKTSFNDVLLRSEWNIRITDLSVKTEWDPAHKEGRLDIHLVIQGGEDHAPDRLFVRAVVQDPNGGVPTLDGSRRVVEAPWPMPEMPCGIRLSGSLRYPWFWTQENSHSYSLVLILEDGRGRIVDTVTGRFGFVSPEAKTPDSPIAEKS